MNNRSKVMGGLTASFVAAVMVFSVLTPAFAVEGGTETTARLIAAVAPDQGPVKIGTQSAQKIANQMGDARISIPTDPTHPITAEMTKVAGKPSFEFNLPPEVRLGKGQVASDGTVVYQATDGGADAAVQILGDGSTRVQTIIPNSSGPRAFTYSFGDGYAPVEAGNGTIVILGQSGFATVDQAWARDANGNPVTTHYEIHGKHLVQVVDITSTTAYPVVADPTWAWYNAAYGAKLNRSETHTLATAGGVTGMCVAVTRIAGAVGATVCAIYGAYLFAQASVADGASPKECVFIPVVPAPLVMRYRDSNCR